MAWNEYKSGRQYLKVIMSGKGRAAHDERTCSQILSRRVPPESWRRADIPVLIDFQLGALVASLQ